MYTEDVTPNRRRRRSRRPIYQQHSSHLTTAVDPGFVLFPNALMAKCSTWRHLLYTHFGFYTNRTRIEHCWTNSNALDEFSCIGAISTLTEQISISGESVRTVRERGRKQFLCAVADFPISGLSGCGGPRPKGGPELNLHMLVHFY